MSQRHTINIDELEYISEAVGFYHIDKPENFFNPLTIDGRRQKFNFFSGQFSRDKHSLVSKIEAKYNNNEMVIIFYNLSHQNEKYWYCQPTARTFHILDVNNIKARTDFPTALRDVGVYTQIHFEKNTELFLKLSLKNA